MKNILRNPEVQLVMASVCLGVGAMFVGSSLYSLGEDNAAKAIVEANPNVSVDIAAGEHRQRDDLTGLAFGIGEILIGCSTASRATSALRAKEADSEAAPLPSPTELSAIHTSPDIIQN